MYRKLNYCLILLLISTSASKSIAQVSFGGNYTENFNSYAGTLGSVPNGWSYSASNLTYRGQGDGGSPSTSGSLANAGGAYAFAINGTNDFSLGSLRSGTTGDITSSVNFLNSTGAAITQLFLSFDYKQFRFAGNSSGFDLSGTGGLSGNSVVNAADFIGSPTGTNGTPSVTPINLQLTGLNIATGATFGFSFVTTDQAGSDNGVAVDNFQLSTTAVPEPSSMAMLGLVGLGGWVGQRIRKRHAAKAEPAVAV